MRGVSRARFAVPAVAAVVAALVALLATGWGARAADDISSVLVANTASQPVPVHETGAVTVTDSATTPLAVAETGAVTVTDSKAAPLAVAETATDPAGDVKVHEEGTANVNVTNQTLTTQDAGRPSLVIGAPFQQGVEKTVLPAVPAGEAFVVKEVMIHSVAGTSSLPSDLRATCTLGVPVARIGGSSLLQLAVLAVPVVSYSTFATNQQVYIVVPSETRLAVRCGLERPPRPPQCSQPKPTQLGGAAGEDCGPQPTVGWAVTLDGDYVHAAPGVVHSP